VPSSTWTTVHPVPCWSSKAIQCRVECTRTSQYTEALVVDTFPDAWDRKSRTFGRNLAYLSRSVPLEAISSPWPERLDHDLPHDLPS